MGESPAPLRGAARHPPALRPAGTVPPDMAPPERCPVVMVPLLRHGSTGHGIWCRLRPARYLGGTALRGYATPQGMQSLKVRNPSRYATPQGTQPLKTRNPSRHAIRKSASGGGTAGPIGPAGRCRAIARHGVRCRQTWCRQSAARFLVPPNGAAQNRLAKARLKTGGGPAARPADRPGGMVPPDWAARGMVPGNCPARGMVPAIAGTVWCRLRAARRMVPAKAGTENGAG